MELNRPEDLQPRGFTGSLGRKDERIDLMGGKRPLSRDDSRLWVESPGKAYLFDVRGVHTGEVGPVKAWGTAAEALYKRRSQPPGLRIPRDWTKATIFHRSWISMVVARAGCRPLPPMP